MFFTGITEAYDYQTTEGWWAIYASFPSQEYIDWLLDFKPDVWLEEVNFPNKQSHSHTILIKDPKRYMLFKLRWYSEAEYMICRKNCDHSASFHLEEGRQWGAILGWQEEIEFQASQGNMKCA
jgi:hypothetical protein